MPFSTKIINLFFTSRRNRIDHFLKHPHSVQADQLGNLLKQGRSTLLGKEYGMASVNSIVDFQRRIPVFDYESFSPYIRRVIDGEKNVIWPSDIKWFAKSSGTTSSKSKFIPVSNEGLGDCHMQGPRDVMALFTYAFPDTKVFHGKTLTLGGSKRIERQGDAVYSGDLSAILLENTPQWANLRRVPSVETALTPDFEEKVRKICEETVGQNVSSFAGVPSWNLVMLNKVLDYTGKSNLLEVWPNLELFIYGGMNFRPYREQYKKIIPSDMMKYMETYNASEGFFAIADDLNRDDMLLMLDYNMFYEFIPTATLHKLDSAVPLEGVIEGVNYAMLITNSNGLWRYMIGDTIEFTSTAPYRIRITGRTKHYINAFGEELVIENAEKAMRDACDMTNAEISEYTAAPIYMDGRKKGAHQWIIEFSKEPYSIGEFTNHLDTSLQRYNSDYEAKRFKDTTLHSPVVTVVPKGTFHEWMKQRGKMGGQNKVPRLYNDRTYVEQLVNLAKAAQV